LSTDILQEQFVYDKVFHIMQLKVSPLINNGMVLQAGVSVPVRGEAAPEAEISVLFLGKIYHAGADSNGAWRLLLESRSPGGPYTMEISAGNSEKITEKIIIEDIYIGDVWICSGQSNMEMPMQRLKDDFPEEWEAPVNSLIRQFKVPQECAFSGPRQEFSGGSWMTAGAETLHEFSGTAWFFARALYEKHPVPMGLINAAWGGTPAEAWMSREALALFPEKIAMGEHYADPAFREEIVRKNEMEVKTWEDALRAADAGLAADWRLPETDTSQWDDINLPGDFADVGLSHFCGVIWLSKEFEAGGEFAVHDAKLWLGTIVDADTVYINGVEAGNTTYRYPPRKYPVPAGMLHAGKNKIIIRVVCNNGEGGVTRDKDFRIFSGNECIKLDGTWKYRVGASAAPRPEEFFLHRQPMCLFNAMIAPLLDYPCKGVLWYQGESNDRNPHEYAALFTALINDWRSKKRAFQPEPHDLPFLFVQLPIFGEPEDNNEESSWAIIRKAQCSALSLPATGMAAGLELGEWNDLHPINKKGIGCRLALAAEQVVFKSPNTSPGPLVRRIERRGDLLLISFNNCGAGLTVKERRDKREEIRGGSNPILSYLSVVDKEGGVFRLSADIKTPSCLAVDISMVQNPHKVLYAWANNPRDRQLFNADGLPVIPFQATIT